MGLTTLGTCVGVEFLLLSGIPGEFAWKVIAGE